MVLLIALKIASLPFYAFEGLALVAGLSGLFIHLAANFSLLRIAIKRLKKRMAFLFVNLKIAFSIFGEIALSIGAALFTGVDLILSMASGNKYLVYLFLGWIIIGFLYIEVIEIGKDEKNTNKAN